MGAEAVKQYLIIAGDGFITIRLTGALERVDDTAFFEDLTLHFLDPYPHIVVNCEHVSAISKSWFRLLMQVKKLANQYNKSIILIRVSRNMKDEIRNQGLDKAFKIVENLRDALADVGLVTKKALNTDFINPFLTATLHVLEIQAKVEAIPKEIYIKKEKDKFVGDISGVIGIVSETFNGSVVISFPEKTFLKIMTGMLDEECTSITKELSDGAGELTNMIFGQAKISLNEKGYGLKTAIPSVVSGKDHTLTSLTTGPVVVVPFQSSAGDFYIEICLSS